MTKSKFKAFCNRCKGDTNHMVVAEHSVEEDVEFDGGEYGLQKQTVGIFNFQTIECAGCEYVTYRTVDVGILQTMSIDEETKQLKLIEPQDITTRYPEILQDWLTEKRIVDLPILIRRAYKEVIDCYNYNLLLSCASGLRAIVEALCNQASIPTKSFNGQENALGWRIRQLEKRNLISKALADALQEHKEIGNVALHNLHAPNREAIKIAIELVETALSDMFSIGRQHNELKSKMMNSITNT